MGSWTNPSKPYFGVVSSRIACLFTDCLVDLISSLKLHAGKASQSKQTTIPKKRKWLN